MRLSRSPWNLDASFFASLPGPDLSSLLSLIARHSLWVDPRVDAAIGVAFPKTARLVVGRERLGEIIDGVRRLTNQPPIHAFFHALGSHPRWFVGRNVCHIWGEAVHDPRHYTRLANLVTLPATLARFSDSAPVGTALKRRAFELYGYTGPRRKAPPKPAAYPDDWSDPVAPANLEKTIAKMRKARDLNPMYYAPNVPSPDGVEAGGQTIMPKHAPARDLDAEFWQAARRDRRTVPMFVRWVVENASFAPPSIVKAQPLPFPLARRVRPNTTEQRGRLQDGEWLVNNTPASRALLLAIGRPVTGAVEGATTNHIWDGAAYSPAHYSHLAGLVLVPLCFSSLVDAPPIRGLLQRHTYERTGYCGPPGTPPPPSSLMPTRWPELVHLSPAQEAHIVARLHRWRLTRPGYFPRSAPVK